MQGKWQDAREESLMFVCSKSGHFIPPCVNVWLQTTMAASESRAPLTGTLSALIFDRDVVVRLE